MEAKEEDTRNKSLHVVAYYDGNRSARSPTVMMLQGSAPGLQGRFAE